MALLSKKCDRFNDCLKAGTMKCNRSCQHYPRVLESVSNRSAYYLVKDKPRLMPKNTAKEGALQL